MHIHKWTLKLFEGLRSRQRFIVGEAENASKRVKKYETRLPLSLLTQNVLNVFYHITCMA